MKKIHLKKQLGILKPVDQTDIDTLYNLKEGKIYSCEIKEPRNIGFHRMFFAMINICFDNQEVFNNVDNFREEMLKASGYFTSYTNHKQVIVYKAESISFASMKQDDFVKVYEAVFMTCIQIFKWSKVENEFRSQLEDLRIK